MLAACLPRSLPCWSVATAAGSSCTLTPTSLAPTQSRPSHDVPGSACRSVQLSYGNPRAILFSAPFTENPVILMFVDRVTIYVKGGDGGSGCCSFRREKYVPKGGPDGGDGGDGGDVIVRAVAGTDSLAEIVNRKHWRAPRGGRGMPANCHGRKADDLYIDVPPGTIISDRDRGNVLRDLTAPGEQVVVAAGGRGGRGNKAFATATNRAPRQTQPGTPGEERWLVLELKVIADV